MNSNEFLESAQNKSDQIIKIRRNLHQNAEVGFDLKNTLEIVKVELKKLEIEFEEAGKCGLVAIIGKQTEGKTLMLRADMDALPINEEADVDFACKNGNMHACGHDMHTAMLLGAAAILKENEDKLKGRVKLMFQPAEEILQGADDMIKSGALENPEVDCALMLHTMMATPLESGSIIVASSGASAPSAEYFEVKILGKGTHGAMPEKGIDPLCCGAQIVLALNEIPARELAMADMAVLTVGKLEGAQALNVIPDTVTLGGTFRALDGQVHSLIKTRIKEICENICKAFRTTCEVEFKNYTPALLNDERLCEKALIYSRQLLGENMAFSQEELTKGSNKIKGSGSEDFAFVSQKVPSVMLAIACGKAEDGYTYPLHHPKVKFDEAALCKGAAVHSYLAYKLLSE